MQLQAGYILESVRDALNAYAKRHEKSPALHGLLRSLSTFEVQTVINFETPANPPSIFAIAGDSADTDHYVPLEADHRFRAKLTM